MWQNEEEYIVRCDCGGLDHLVHLEFYWWGDPEYAELSIHMIPDGGTLWERIKKAFWFVVRQNKIYHYGDVEIDLISEKGRKEVAGLISFLQKVLEQSKKENLLALHEKWKKGLVSLTNN